MKVALTLLVALLAAGCGRTALGPIQGGDAGGDTGRDVGAIDGPGDTSGAEDRDAADGSDAADAAGVPSCLTCPSYDPGRVYLLGTLTDSQQGESAFIDPVRPDVLGLGFPVYTTPVIRPSDGRLLYAGYLDEKAYVFVPDLPGPGGAYPEAPGSNDEPVDTSACVDGGVASIFVFPDDSATAYTCRNAASDGVLYVAGSPDPLVPAQVGVLAVGAARAALVVLNGLQLLVGPGPSLQPVSGERSWFDDSVATRWNGDSFRMALVQQRFAPAKADLARIDLDGTLTIEGSYRLDDLPSDTLERSSCVLEPGGALQCFAERFDAGSYALIVRITFDAPPETVYDERDHPVKIDLRSSWLVTGP